MIERRRTTPPGTWPLLVSGAQFLLFVPAVFLGQVVPDALSLLGSLVFGLVSLGAVIWSYSLYRAHKGSSNSAIPLTGVIIGLIVAVLSATVLLPASVG